MDTLNFETVYLNKSNSGCTTFDGLFSV